MIYVWKIVNFFNSYIKLKDYRRNLLRLTTTGTFIRTRHISGDAAFWAECNESWHSESLQWYLFRWSLQHSTWTNPSASIMLDCQRVHYWLNLVLYHPLPSVSCETSSNLDTFDTLSNRLECHKVPRLPRKTTWEPAWWPSKRRGFAASPIDTELTRPRRPRRDGDPTSNWRRTRVQPPDPQTINGNTSLRIREKCSKPPTK